MSTKKRLELFCLKQYHNLPTYKCDTITEQCRMGEESERFGLSVTRSHQVCTLNMPDGTVWKSYASNTNGEAVQQVSSRILNLYESVANSKCTENDIMRQYGIRDHNLEATPLAKPRSFKSILHELCSKLREHHPLYQSVKVGGADHNPQWQCTITMECFTWRMESTHASVQKAEEAAAQYVVKRMKVVSGKLLIYSTAEETIEKNRACVKKREDDKRKNAYVTVLHNATVRSITSTGARAFVDDENGVFLRGALWKALKEGDLVQIGIRKYQE